MQKIIPNHFVSIHTEEKIFTHFKGAKVSSSVFFCLQNWNRTCAALPEDEVVRPEGLSVGPAPDGVHGSRLQVHQDGARHELALVGLVEVDGDLVQLLRVHPLVPAHRVDAVLSGDHLPELQGGGEGRESKKALIFEKKNMCFLSPLQKKQLEVG